MACSKFKGRFGDKSVEIRIETIERGRYGGDFLEIRSRQVHLKFKVWDEYVGKVCERLRALANEIDLSHKRANRAKVAGGVIGVVSGVGGAIGIGAGIVLAIPTGGISLLAAGAVVGVCTAGGVVGGGAGGVTAAVAVGADHLIQHFKHKEAQELFGVEKKLRDHIIECLADLQLMNSSSPESEEFLNLILRMQGDDYSDSLNAIRKGKGIIWALTGCNFDENNLRKIIGLFQVAFSSTSSLGGFMTLGGCTTLSVAALPSVSVLLASNLPTVAVIGLSLVATSILLHSINLAVTLHDMKKGSRTALAAQLRKHVKLLENNRDEYREALPSILNVK